MASVSAYYLFWIEKNEKKIEKRKESEMRDKIIIEGRKLLHFISSRKYARIGCIACLPVYSIAALSFLVAY